MMITLIRLLQHIAKMLTAAKLLSPLLAERYNDRAYATVLRLSVCDVYIVAKRCVLEQKLLNIDSLYELRSRR